jgi:hypothetical protein
VTFILPELCNILKSGDYINFYIGMGVGFEGGVSFSARKNGWNAFFNVTGIPQQDILEVVPQLGPKQQVTMSLERLPSKVVEFSINSKKRDSKKIKLTNAAQVRLVNAAGYDGALCPPKHSAAAWGVPVVKGGMQAHAVLKKTGGDKVPSEQIITDNPLSSYLLNPDRLCNKDQFSK